MSEIFEDFVALTKDLVKSLTVAALMSAVIWALWLSVGGKLFPEAPEALLHPGYWTAFQAYMLLALVKGVE